VTCRGVLLGEEHRQEGGEGGPDGEHHMSSQPSRLSPQLPLKADGAPDHGSQD